MIIRYRRENTIELQARAIWREHSPGSVAETGTLPSGPDLKPHPVSSGPTLRETLHPTLHPDPPTLRGATAHQRHDSERRLNWVVYWNARLTRSSHGIASDDRAGCPEEQQKTKNKKKKKALPGIRERP